MASASGPAPEARFIRETGIAADIASLTEPVLDGLGFRLVRVRIMGGQDTIVEIMAERLDGSMSVEDCKTVSHNLSPVFDVHDPLPGSYRLQVSSPGIDRPLVRPGDFEQWAGHEAKIELKEPIDGRKRFRGVLDGYADGEVRIKVDLDKDGPQVLGFPVGLIGDARLVLTDELVRESLRRGKDRIETQQGTSRVHGGQGKVRV
jgi:ribosome maturation factor RimP